MKTSVWLSDEIAERWKQSKLPLAELVRRGLDAPEPEQVASPTVVRAIVREELERVAGRV
jgi:hypothetical protein